MRMTLDIGQSRTQIDDVEQLREALLAAHEKAAHQSIIALLNAPDGSCLAVGLGSHRSVLNHLAPGGWPSRHAVDNTAGEGFVEYTLAGQLSEIQLRGTIPVEDAMDACLEFMRTGKITEALEWEED